MGYSAIQITVDIYGHILPTENRNILNSLDTPNHTPDAPTEIKKAATR
jgi:integrase